MTPVAFLNLSIVFSVIAVALGLSFAITRIGGRRAGSLLGKVSWAFAAYIIAMACAIFVLVLFAVATNLPAESPVVDRSILWAVTFPVLGSAIGLFKGLRAADSGNSNLGSKPIGAVFIVLGVLLGIGGLSVAMQPSPYPLVTVIGAFAIPALFLVTGYRLSKRGTTEPTDKG